ncbi:MAG TPA: MBL fold metallo-hydrolase [Bdellovibrio sp.]|nr:MBL fold metallo-hydrolase [Bdellovibrio sp.]
MDLHIQHFFDDGTFTLTYVVFDAQTKDTVIIDPVWNYDLETGELSTSSFDAVVHFLKNNNLRPHFVLETHAHADHLSSSQLFKNIYPEIKTAIGEGITKVQNTFKKVFSLENNFDVSGKAFDLLLKDQQTLQAGSLHFKVIATPGHTPACISYLIEDALFTGDALFMPDSGTGRCDFPGGSAETLYESITKGIYSLPDKLRLFVGHDYQPQGRVLKYQTTVGEEKSENIQLKGQTTKNDFIEFRTKRDATLKPPRLLEPSIRVNINGGRVPEGKNQGASRFKNA